MGRRFLLLSATISPPAGVPFLARTDPKQRRDDYRRALTFYLETAEVDGFIFADNSAQDVSDLMAQRKHAAVRRTFLSFDGVNHPPAYGRAYGEFKLVEHAHQNAPLLRGLQPDDYVWKVTGRYIVRNINSILRRSDADVCINLRNRPLRWADLYCLGYNPRGYEGFVSGLYHRLREDLLKLPPELFVRLIVDDIYRRQAIRIRRRFPVVPVVDGIRGFDNRSYLESGNLWKTRSRQAARVLCPWLWI